MSSNRICQAMGSTATPRLKAGALQHTPRHLLPAGIPAALRSGGLIPNPLVSTADSPPSGWTRSWPDAPPC